MTVGELIAVLDNSQRLQVIEGEKILFCGWNALLPYDENEEYIKTAKVKRFNPYIEINHKKWKEKGLIAPMQPEVTPDYSFSDLQLTLYNTIYI